MLLKIGEQVVWARCQRAGCKICNDIPSEAHFGVFVVKSAYQEGDGDWLVSVDKWAPPTTDFHADDTFEGSGINRFYERHLTPIGGMPVDRILAELMGSLEAEDAAQRALWDAKHKTQMVMRDNLKELLNTGVIKISVNRDMVNRLMKIPVEKKVR